jgi:predicted aspartyl protease
MRNFSAIFISVFIIQLNLFGMRPVRAQNQIGFEVVSPDGYTEIPFELKNNIVIVNVLFNSILPLRFIVDTGVRNIILLEKSYSEMVNVVPERTLKLVGAAGGAGVEAFIAHGVNIDLYGLSGKNLSILILADDYLELGKVLGTEVHGILGYDLFRNHQIEINYDQRLLIISEAGKSRSRLFYRPFDLNIEESKPYIFCEVETKDNKKVNAKLMIDTGASHALLLHTDSHEDIDYPKKTIQDLIGVGLAGDIFGKIGRIHKIKFGHRGYELSNVITSFPDQGAYSDVVATTGRNGTIGGMLLKQFNVVFDYPSGKLWLRRPFFKEPFTYDMSGLSMIAEGVFYERIVIKSIRDGSAAQKAGLQLNDQIIRVNSYYGRNLDLNLVNNLMRKKEGKRVNMTVIRDGEQLKFRFKLESII